MYSYRNHSNPTRLVVIAIVSVVCLVLFGSCCIGVMSGGVEYSEGHREGLVQKFSSKGFIWKTYEGELALPGWKKTGTNENPGFSNIWEFTASNPEIVKELQSIHSDEKVRLHYKQYLFVPPWKGSTQYFIVKIERIK